jgi:hypothetical protein
LLPATEALALEELGEGFTISGGGEGPCLIPAREAVEGRGYAPFVPWIHKVSLSPGGEAWVQRRNPDRLTESVIDVFDRSGTYIGTLPESAPVPLFFLDESHIAAAETDELDVTRLVVYEVDRGGS